MSESSPRRFARGALAAFFILDGVLHLLVPSPFVAITPRWIPDPTLAVAASGIAAIAGGVGLLAPTARRAAGAALALYAVVVFPANVRHALENVPINGVTLGWAYHAPRLAFQPVLVWWCLWASGIIDWPFRRNRTRPV